MKAYLLPEPSGLESSLRKKLSGSPRPAEAWRRYPNGELALRVASPGKKAAVVGRVGADGSGFFLTLGLVHAVRRAGAKDVVLVLPYLGYARHDKPKDRFDAFPPAMLAWHIAAAGVSRVVVAEAHGEAFAEACPVPVENVAVLPHLAAPLKAALKGKAFTVAAPDFGAKARAADAAAALGTGAIAWVRKTRDARGRTATSGLGGLVKGETAVLVDDMVDTGGTIEGAVRELRRAGIRRFHLVAAHPVLSAGAVRRLARLGFASITFGDALPLPAEAKALKGLKVVSLAPLLAKAARG